MDNGWKSYFSFTKKERTGITTLLALIGISTLVPYLWPVASVPDDVAQQALNAQRERIAAVLADTLHKLPAPITDSKNTVTRRVETFRFNPNTLDAEGWRRLGIGDRTIRTIQNYLRKGGQFRRPEDLGKIYGFSAKDHARLAAYIDIPVMEPRRMVDVKEKPAITSIDINAADTAALIALRGIGPALARRIIGFREKLGGFYSVEQVGETYGLADSTFQLIKTRLVCVPGTVRKININTADAAALKQHPYIKWAVANAIVQYRQQHGEYQSLEELQRVVLVTPELYGKVAGYLTVE